MGPRNKIVRQESWLQAKAAKGRQRIQERRDRRREEEKNPELKAERLAKNKPQTIEDKREYPTSEDYYARRKRRKVAEAAAVEEPEAAEAEDEDAMDMTDTTDKERKKASRHEQDEDEDEDDDDDEEEADDSDIASLLASDSEDDEEADDGDAASKARAAKAAKGPKTASSKDGKDGQDGEDEATAAARKAHEDAMAAKYEALLPPLAEGAEGATEPRLLITTSRHATIHRFAQTLVDLFPNSTYIPRSQHRYVRHEYSLREIAGYAHARGFTALLVLNEDQKRPTGLDVALLPAGPMLHFAVKTWVDARRLPNHGRSTGHAPEVLLNRFDTPLGRLVGGVLSRLFPAQPDLVGRQVVTLHNQRDFVFVRRHRYMVRDKRATERSVAGTDGRPLAGVEDLRVALQEIGPRMTLKLRRVDKGIQRMSGQAFEWSSRMDKKRTIFQL